MEAILPIIVQIVTGVLGGQAIGAVLTGGDKSADQDH